MKKRTLISVSDKTGLIEFAQFLEQNNYELISTGGTFKHLKEAGLNPIPIDEVTNFPEMLDGRVKTLHPKVHGGLLAVRDNAEHMKTVAEHHIGLIDMVVVNLYPFFENANKNISLDEKVEFIDIGGPSMPFLRCFSTKSIRSILMLLIKKWPTSATAKIRINRQRIMFLP